jgi:hypothetical protein
MLRTLWNKLCSQPAAARKQPKAYLQVENLEERAVPSAVSCKPKARCDSYCCVNVGQKFHSPFSVLKNDCGRNLKAVLVCGPKHGKLTLNKNGNFCYTPDPKFKGSCVEFKYKAVNCRTGKESCPVKVKLHINWPPVAVKDQLSTVQSLPVSSNVLANDFDPDKGPKALRVVSVYANGQVTDIPDGGSATFTTAGGGSVTIYSNGAFTYTPDPNFTGTDKFSYTITDGCACAKAEVCIEVGPGGKANLFAR